MILHIPRELDNELKKEKSLVDSLALLAGITGPLATIPQAINVWNGEVAGVSMLMWIIFLVGTLILILYSVLYRFEVTVHSTSHMAGYGVVDNSRNNNKHLNKFWHSSR